MKNLKKLARLALAAKLITDFGKKETAAAKDEAMQLMLESGADRVRITADDGTDLGTMTYTRRANTPAIMDQVAFDAWVRERHPDRIKMVEQVDEKWLARLMNTARQLGDAVDPETGEVIPGVVMRATTEPFLTIRPTEIAREHMDELLEASGLLQFDISENIVDLPVNKELL